MHCVFSLLLLVGLDGPAGVGTSASELAESETTKHFVVRYRKGSKAGAAVDRVAWMAEAEYRRICDTLELKGRVDEREPFYLFLYDDLDELTKVTAVAGTGGFSTARESHIPFDNDQTRVHEMVHIVVAAVKESGPEPRNMFFVEGIANAVLRFVHGVPVHAVAAYEKKRGTLPPIATLAAANFYDYLAQNPGFNGYDVGGSFMLFLLDTYGPKKTVDFYKGKAADKSLGISLDKAERAWLEFLDRYAMRPELHALLAERRGDLVTTQTLSPELLGDAKEWVDFAPALVMNDSFRLEKGVVLGECASSSDWALCDAKSQRYKNCMIRATIRAIGPCYGVQLHVGQHFQAMVLGQGSFLYYKDVGGIAFTDLIMLQTDQTLDLLLIVRDGSQEVWIDGTRRLEAKMPSEEGPIGIGVVGGKAEFKDLKVRPLK
jgi:hypothetical protein